jgi:L-rhamnonate dehydratase
MPDLAISQIEWGMFEGVRPRAAGSNARLGDHGLIVRVPIARLTTESGISGFGFCRLSRDAAESLLGQPLDQLATVEAGISTAGLAIEYPLWDLLGQFSGKPVYALTAALTGRSLPSGSYQVPCYDTSLYFDDLHLANDAAWLHPQYRQACP